MGKPESSQKTFNTQFFIELSRRFPKIVNIGLRQGESGGFEGITIYARHGLTDEEKEQIRAEIAKQIIEFKLGLGTIRPAKKKTN